MTKLNLIKLPGCRARHFTGFSHVVFSYGIKSSGRKRSVLLPPKHKTKYQFRIGNKNKIPGLEGRPGHSKSKIDVHNV